MPAKGGIQNFASRSRERRISVFVLSCNYDLLADWPLNSKFIMTTLIEITKQMTCVDFLPSSSSTSARVVTSKLVISTKLPFLLGLTRGVLAPLTKTIWRGRVGTHDFGAITREEIIRRLSL